ncbi:Arm DNA-binding domain-containing protein [Pseudoxanthomonas sacheonensis]|uniref:Arm DNA-binding domain-containing protein n=1 Tax=Pseudoxanthomonas sacheonensis TaxID=443615 RepID=UPI00286A50E1|nr:Arm DNA-binding domain-containing protein [Pseudoxanthomonas sacheonensis]
MPLAAGIRKTKPTNKTQRLFGGGGMYLEISPTGGKWWRLKYRSDGKEKRLSLGTYPDTSLAAARDKRDNPRKLLAAGVDPGEHRKAEKAAGIEKSANSFEVGTRSRVAANAARPSDSQRCGRFESTWLSNGLSTTARRAWICLRTLVLGPH